MTFGRHINVLNLDFRDSIPTTGSFWHSIGVMNIIYSCENVTSYDLQDLVLF